MSSPLRKITTTGSGLAMLAVAVVALNIIAARVFVRLDVTDERVFSLSDGTKRILEKQGGDVTAKLYFSRSLKDLPVVIKTYATRVEEVLNEYAVKSRGRLRVEVIDPKPDTDDEEWAQKYGLSGVRLPKGDQMYFGVVFLAGTKEVPLPYLDPRREEFLEYDLSEALVSVFKKDPPKVGILSSLPLFGGDKGQKYFLAVSGTPELEELNKAQYFEVPVSVGQRFDKQRSDFVEVQQAQTAPASATAPLPGKG